MKQIYVPFYLSFIDYHSYQLQFISLNTQAILFLLL